MVGIIDRKKKDRGASAMASNSIGPERHHLARQVQAFRGHAKRLKRIFKDTVKVLSDLQDFDESLSIDQILAVDAQKCISNVVSGRTALVVFGDTRLRASIVNEILGKLKEREGEREREMNNSSCWREREKGEGGRERGMFHGNISRL